MKKWEKYFIISGCTRFVLPVIGEINADAEISEEKLLAAYKIGCPFVGLTDAGVEKYDPEKKIIKVNLIEEKPFKQKRKYFNEKPQWRLF